MKKETNPDKDPDMLDDAVNDALRALMQVARKATTQKRPA